LAWLFRERDKKIRRDGRASMERRPSLARGREASMVYTFV
jgi:hypothetical protein